MCDDTISTVFSLDVHRNRLNSRDYNMRFSRQNFVRTTYLQDGRLLVYHNELDRTEVIIIIWLFCVTQLGKKQIGFVICLQR